VLNNAGSESHKKQADLMLFHNSKFMLINQSSFSRVSFSAKSFESLTMQTLKSTLLPRSLPFYIATHPSTHPTNQPTASPTTPERNSFANKIDDAWKAFECKKLSSLLPFR